MLATCKLGGSDQDWHFNSEKQKLRYIWNQEEVEDGSSWLAGSSHFVVEPPTTNKKIIQAEDLF